jgi:hypothetical protein
VPAGAPPGRGGAAPTARGVTATPAATKRKAP